MKVVELVEKLVGLSESIIIMSSTESGQKIQVECEHLIKSDKG